MKVSDVVLVIKPDYDAIFQIDYEHNGYSYSRFKRITKRVGTVGQIMEGRGSFDIYPLYRPENVYVYAAWWDEKELVFAFDSFDKHEQIGQEALKFLYDETQNYLERFAQRNMVQLWQIIHDNATKALLHVCQVAATTAVKKFREKYVK